MIGPSLPDHPYDSIRSGNGSDVVVVVGCTTDEMLAFMFFDPDLWTLGLEDVSDRLRSLLGEDAPRIVSSYQAIRPDLSPTSLLVAISTDAKFRIPAIRVAEAKVGGGGAPVYMYAYAWGHPDPGGTVRAPHGLDMPYFFDNVDKAPIAAGPRPNLSRRRRAELSGHSPRRATRVMRRCRPGRPTPPIGERRFASMCPPRWRTILGAPSGHVGTTSCSPDWAVPERPSPAVSRGRAGPGRPGARRAMRHHGVRSLLVAVMRHERTSAVAVDPHGAPAGALGPDHVVERVVADQHAGRRARRPAGARPPRRSPCPAWPRGGPARTPPTRSTPASPTFSGSRLPLESRPSR